MSEKKYNTPADRLKAFRERQKAAKASTPTAPTVEASPEDTEKIEQMSRAAGVPRNYPLSVWKRAAEAIIQGEGKTQAKVKLLRGLCATDKAMRKKVADWVRADQSEASRKFAAAQGWTLTDGAAQPQSLADRMVAVIEAARRKGEDVDKALAANFTAEEINGPAVADPEHDELWAALQAHDEKMKAYPPSSRKCGIAGCTEDFKTDFDGVKRCDKHSQTSQYLVGAPAPVTNPHSPAAYINSSFGAAPSPGYVSSSDPAFATLPPQARVNILLREASAGQPVARGGADFGPVNPKK